MRPATPGRRQADAELYARALIYYVLGFTVDEQSRLQWDAAGALADEQSILIRDATGSSHSACTCSWTGWPLRKTLRPKPCVTAFRVDDGAQRHNS